MKASDAFGASLLTILSFYAIILSRWWVKEPKVGSICGPTERSSYNAEMGPLEGWRGCEAAHLTVRFAGGHFFMLSTGDRRATPLTDGGVIPGCVRGAGRP